MALPQAKTRISFMDFVERTAAMAERYRAFMSSIGKGEVFIPPPFKNTHIFHLGEDVDILDAIAPIRLDIAQDCAEGVPMPFGDVSCVSIVPAKGEFGWILDRVIEAPPSMPEEPPQAEEVKARGWTVRQRLAIVRHTEFDVEVDGIPLLWVWRVWFCGTEGQNYRALTEMDPGTVAAIKTIAPRLDQQAFMQVMGKETVPVLEQLAAISHPQNYLVKVTPHLTAREERRMAYGGERPVRKAPHFIIVDHDVLAEMPGRGGPSGAHASPVPHHRRGHWRRLAERCQAARLLGKDRVFVRPAYVGEREFSDEKNVYEVLLDFNKET